MASRKSIVVVGPCGSGKSTLVDHLRTPDMDPHIVIPKRVITLPVRGDSDPVENRNVSNRTFSQEVAAGGIKPWWSRRFGEGEDDMYYYGFEKPPKSDSRTRLYLGNNALLASDRKQVRKLMDRSLVVVVRAQPEVRAERIDYRLPDMAADERAKRIADGLERLVAFSPLATVEIDTTQQSVTESAWRLRQIVLQHAGVPSPAGAPAIEMMSPSRVATTPA
ncbi:hypothetical protein KC957_02610 [Candidatus Saccharibacteria bacterium]|nr:hypothetical protein [Candidatus Saccharibacteria bacterium]